MGPAFDSRLTQGKGEEVSDSLLLVLLKVVCDISTFQVCEALF